jgi:solute carrier family 35, member F5
MFITLSSDYVYVVAMLKTTPLVVTIGLSLTMPLAVMGDIALQHSVKAQVILGAALVLVSFVVIGLEDAKRPPGDEIGVQDEISDVEATDDNRQ